MLPLTEPDGYQEITLACGCIVRLPYYADTLDYRKVETLYCFVHESTEMIVRVDTHADPRPD